MRIAVPIKLVPDLVEELIIDESGTALDALELSLCLNEFDDHAIEQAILLKERDGSQATIITPDVEGADHVLFNAAAKGADQLIRLAGDFENGVSNHAYARLLKPVIMELKPDLILTGVQAHNDLDGQLGPLLAEYLGFPYIGYVAGVKVARDKAVLRKEYPGGLVGELEVTLPAVLGIQAAEQPPRYVAFSRIRQIMKTAVIEEQAVLEPDETGVPVVTQMYQPKTGQQAQMLVGEANEIAGQLLGILAEKGYLNRG